MTTADHPPHQGAALSDADIDQLVKDIHDAIAELAGVARYPDLTEAIERLASCAAADRRLTAEQPEDTAEKFIQAAIDSAPEPLRRLGEYLARVLDEDQWATAERMLLGLTAEQPVGKFWCESCDGTGKIDERLTAYSDSNPAAECPDCDGNGWWQSAPVTAEQGGADLRDVLIRNGFVECDIAACNCGSWHARYGYPERFQEFKDMLSDAGHPTCNDNGNLASKALAELIAERDALRAALTTQPQAEPQQALRNLLAVIHRDGGHYTEEHGLDESVAAAMRLVPELLVHADPPAQPQAEPAGKYDDVLRPFFTIMESELHANSRKGDRPGWLSMSREQGLLEIYWHTAKLSAAVKNNDAALIREHSADVANMAMMLLDVCGGLDVAPCWYCGSASPSCEKPFDDVPCRRLATPTAQPQAEPADAERCACGYPQPCVKTVPVGFCRATPTAPTEPTP